MFPLNMPMQKWKTDWLMDEELLNCSECYAVQFCSHSNTDFLHDRTCSRRGPGQRPWEDLYIILTNPAND
jgi:hypothetical protein